MMIVLAVVVVINIVFAIVIHGEQGAKWWVLVEIFIKIYFIWCCLFCFLACMALGVPRMIGRAHDDECRTQCLM